MSNCVCVCLQTLLAERALHPGGAQTLPGHGVTRACVLTATQAVTGRPVGPLWTRWRCGVDGQGNTEGRGVGVGVGINAESDVQNFRPVFKHTPGPCSLLTVTV